MKNIITEFSFSKISYAVGFTTAIAGSIILFGWQFNITILKSFGIGTVTIMPNSALLFLIAGVTLLLLQYSNPIPKLISFAFSAMILLFGILTLIEFSFQLNLGIDELIFRVSNTTGLANNPGRIGANAALSFVFLGTLLLFLSLWRTRPNFFIEFCLIGMFSISALGFLGFVFGLSDAAGVTRYSKMAVIAAILFLMMFLGILSTFRQRFLKKISIEQKFFAGLTVIISLFIFNLLLLLANTRQMHEVSGLVQLAELAKKEIFRIDMTVSTVSNSDRVYILTGNKDYLAKVLKSSNEIAGNLKNLRNLTSKKPFQQQALDRLEPLIKEKFDILLRFIQLKNNIGSDAIVFALHRTGREEAINDSIFTITSQMIKEEDQLLIELNVDENYRSNQVMIAVKIGFLFQIFLLTLIFILLKKDLRSRKKSEKTLKDLNEDLEHRITERTAALQKSEKKYRAIFENIQDVFFQTNLDGKVLEISPSITYFSEYESSEIAGFNVTKLFYSPEDRNGMMNVLLKNGEILDYELKIKTKSNELKFASVNALLIYDADNKPDHIDGFVRDITHRKQSANQLELLRWAIEQSPVNIVVTDKKGTIEYVNPKFTQVSGYSLDEVKGENARIMQSGLHPRTFYQELWKTVLSGREWQGEFYNKKKNGEFYWERATISNIVDLKGEITSFISIREDITERKKMLEDLLKAKVQAEESNNLKAAFLNNLSHEIRTPFTGILGLLAAIQEDDLTSLERAEYIDIINENAYKFMNTINDIAEISQIQAGQAVVYLSNIHIRQVIDGLLERLTPDVERKGLQLTINTDILNEVDLISTDPKKLNSILDILTGNAIKFTRKGLIKIDIQKDGDYLAFSVKDNGIGIPHDKQQVIFEPFRQGDGSTTRQFEGLGLGLTIARAYVEMLGGSIRVESQDGQGSTFHFTILCM